MPNLPTIHRNSLTYSTLRRSAIKRARTANESSDALTSVRRNGTDRRRKGDRRHKQIKVLFERRHNIDRRTQGAAIRRSDKHDQADKNSGHRINTTA